MAGIDNNTVLYLRGEDITDSSLTPKPITNNGVTINNDGVIGKSLYFDDNYENGNYLELPSFDNSFLSGDFTIEWREYCLGSVGGTTVSLFNTKTAKSSNMCGFTLGHEGVKLYTLNSSETTQINSVFKDRTNNEWVHWRLVKQGGVWTSYKNGTKFWTTTIEYTPKIDTGAMMGCLYYSTGLGRGYNAYIDEFLITKNVLCTENFTPPTQPYNSITINKTNQTATNINFSVTKLGQETINKVEVLINGIVSETYTDSYDNIDYLIDKELCVLGNNDITIRVTYDDTYAEELSLTHKITLDKLPTSSNLIQVFDRQELLNNSLKLHLDNFRNVLTSKNVEVSEEDKMGDLIGKVDLLGDAPPPPLYLYKDGDECVDITGGWEFKQSNGSSSTGTRQLEKREDCIYMKVVANSSTGHGADTTISLGIDVSEYNYLCFDCKIGHTDAYDRGYLLLINESSSSTIASYTLGKSKQLERQVIKLDISNIKQIGKVRLSCSTVISGNWGENILYNCWLEV